MCRYFLIKVFVMGTVRIIILVGAFNSDKYCSVHIYLFDINNKLIQS
jgi:hypothetical protein